MLVGGLAGRYPRPRRGAGGPGDGSAIDRGDTLLKHTRKWFVRALIVVLFFSSRIESVNPASRLALIESLLERGTVQTDGSPFFNPVDMVYVDGHFYSDKPPLLSLYSAAVLWPVHQVVDFSGSGWRVLYFLVVATSSGLALLVMLLVLRALRRRFPDTSPSTGWLFAAVVGATCVLPFGRTYNDHIVEAALLLLLFHVLLRFGEAPSLRRAGAAGLLVGVVALLHPVPGAVFGSLTLLYFAVAHVGGGSLQPASIGGSNVAAVAGFVAATVLVFAGGLGLHDLLYGTPVPFYFSPESYFWAGVPGHADSAWLLDPSTPGLTAQRLANRFAELGLPGAELNETLNRLQTYQESVRSPLAYAARRLFVYDQITFNPLVLFCLLLGTLTLIRSGFAHRFAWAWALLGVLGLYAATVALRAVPGGSFGNRMILPALPVAVCVGALRLTTAGRAYAFKALVLVGVALVAPGAIGPWSTPGRAYLVFATATGILAIGGIVWFLLSARAEDAVRRWGEHAARRPRLVALAFTVLLLASFLTYASALQFRAVSG